MEESSARLNQTMAAVQEIEEMGVGIVDELGRNRATIERTQVRCVAS